MAPFLFESNPYIYKTSFKGHEASNLQEDTWSSPEESEREGHWIQIASKRIDKKVIPTNQKTSQRLVQRKPQEGTTRNFRGIREEFKGIPLFGTGPIENGVKGPFWMPLWVSYTSASFNHTPSQIWKPHHITQSWESSSSAFQTNQIKQTDFNRS